MKKHKFRPESLMMSYGYNPAWSEGAVKCPIFQTSTFVFNTAEEGKAFFELAYGLREPMAKEAPGLIYSRLNNPDLEILENRLALWEEAEACAVFESGMSAITTVLLEFLKPGDLLAYSNPVYGGTSHFIEHFLPTIGIHVLGFDAHLSKAEIEKLILESGHADRLAMVYVETPANPTNVLTDIAQCRGVADLFGRAERRPLVVVDNTYLGPLWQHPLKCGADLVLYSATKYIGGHSDLIAGAVMGGAEWMARVKTLRTFLGNMAGPWTGWLLLRSLETLQVRMLRQAETARVVAQWLSEHPAVRKVHYLGLLTPSDGEQYRIFKKQCESPGAMISFEVEGGEKAAFAVLNRLELIKLAVSLGSTESLAQHPASMTHAGMEAEQKVRYGVLENLIRLSIGVEHPDDLICDLEQALRALSMKLDNNEEKHAGAKAGN